jgi:geranylgeranyl diphosphate synthase type I
VVIGQYMDLVAAASRSIDAEVAGTIAELKTARYTVERPLHMGAALAGSLDRLAEPLTRFALPVGQAFQLRDDLLGVYGDVSVTGKPVGEDLRNGKPTLLVAIALQRAGLHQRRALSRMGSPALSATDIREIADIIKATAAPSFVEGRIESLLTEALAALDHVELSDEAKEALCALASFAAWRNL